MKSKTSFFNRYLYLKTLLRFWPLWTVTAIGGCVLAVVIVVGSVYLDVVDAKFSRLIFFNEAVEIFPWVSFFYAIIVAMCVWGYLYHRNSNYHFHSMPISRNCLFVTNFLAGYTICLIPFLVAAVLQIAILASISSVQFTGFMYALGTALVENLFFFSMATLVAFITSNSVALPVLYLIFNVLAIAMEGETKTLILGLYPGYGEGKYFLKFLSPIAWVVSEISLETEMYDLRINKCEVVGAYKLWYWVAASLVLMGLSLWLYKTKRNEDVGMAVSVRWLRPVLLVVLSYASAIAGALFISLLAGNFSSREYYQVPVMVGLSVLCGAIAYMVGLMILKRTTRVFNKKNFLSFAAFAFLLSMMIVVAGNDWLFIARDIPDYNEISSVNVNILSDDYKVDASNANLLAKVLEANEQLVKESKYIKSLKDNSFTDNEKYTFENITFTYTLKNGKTVTKVYKVFLTKNRMNQANTYENKLDNLTGEKTFILSRYHMDGNDKVTEVYLHDYYDYNQKILYGSQMNEFLNVLYDDIVENGSLSVDWFYDIDHYQFAIELAVEQKNPGGVLAYQNYYTKWCYFELEDTMTNTVNYLKEHNLITEEALKFVSETYEKDYVSY